MKLSFVFWFVFALMCHLFFQDEKKGSGNAAVADLPRRHPLPLHHLHHLLLLRRRPPPPLLRQAHHTHPAAVGVAPEVVVSVSLNYIGL